MKNKLIAAILVLALSLTQLGVFAFSDMEEERLDWAREAVETMAQKGIIKGYEDGTFRPDNAITKEEALILMSRISGFSEESSGKYKLLATEKYANVLEEYETAYKEEISFLLYRGIININDLKTYAGNDVRTQAIKRYEAAILLTKLMGPGELPEETELDYEDKEDIPEEALPYVYNVTKEGLMNGIGDNLFGPMGNVTRAQIATLLYRAMGKLDYSYVTAVLSEYNESNDIVTITVDEKQEKYVITSDVPVALDGAYATMADVMKGAEIRLTLSGDKVVFVDAITPDYEETLGLVFVKFEKLTDATVLTFEDPITEERIRYSLAKEPVITKNGETSSITAIKADDYAIVHIVNGKIQNLDIKSPEGTFLGIIEKLTFEPELLISIKTEGETKDYKVYDKVSVKRDNKEAQLADILIGDKVTVMTKYGVISKITAVSSVQKMEGTIVEIVISKEPSMIISVDGDDKRFALINTVKVEKNGEDIDVYGLRLGDKATITLESETVTKISVISTEEGTYVTGKVENVNATYGYIKLEGVEELVFVNNAKFQTAAGDSISIKNVKEGKTVIVFGKKAIGTYDATLVVVN